MFMPPQYAWAEPVAIAALVVFLVALIGNSITFVSKLASALVTAIVFALIFGALAYFKLATLSLALPVREPAPVAKPAPAAPTPPANPVTTIPTR